MAFSYCKRLYVTQTQIREKQYAQPIGQTIFRYPFHCHDLLRCFLILHSNRRFIHHCLRFLLPKCITDRTNHNYTGGSQPFYVFIHKQSSSRKN